MATSSDETKTVVLGTESCVGQCVQPLPHLLNWGRSSGVPLELSQYTPSVAWGKGPLTGKGKLPALPGLWDSWDTGVTLPWQVTLLSPPRWPHLC